MAAVAFNFFSFALQGLHAYDTAYETFHIGTVDFKVCK